MEAPSSQSEIPKPVEGVQLVENNTGIDSVKSNGVEKHSNGESMHSPIDSNSLETLAQIYKILEAESKTRNLSGASLNSGGKSSNQLKAEDVLDRVYGVLREEYV